MPRLPDSKCWISVLGGVLLGAGLANWWWSKRCNTTKRLLSGRSEVTCKAAWLQEQAGLRPRVVLIAAGSVATVKVPELAVLLSAVADVAVVLTRSAEVMFTKLAAGYAPEMVQRLKECQRHGRVRVLIDEDEWIGYDSIGADMVVHVELTKWADVTVIAPCSANTLAKMSLGLCDNLATSLLRACDPGKPIVIAPAMNTNMWEHPLTEEHLAVLQRRGHIVLPTAEKRLACGDSGYGALCPVVDILEAVNSALVGFEKRRRRDARGAWRESSISTGAVDAKGKPSLG